MGTRRKTPSLDDAGKMVFELTRKEPEDLPWDGLSKDLKRHYVKLAIEIWREVEKSI